MRFRPSLAARRSTRARRLVWPLVSTLLAVAAWGVVGAQTPPRPVPQVPPPAPSADQPSDEQPLGDPMDDLESKEPPDGKWITAEDGREYFVTRLKKVPGTYFRKEEKVIIYKRLYPLEVDHEDDEYFYIRYYRSTDAADAVQKSTAAGAGSTGEDQGVVPLRGALGRPPDLRALTIEGCRGRDNGVKASSWRT